MLSQQLKSMHSLHLEDVGESVDNPSFTVANNGYYNNATTISPTSSPLKIVTTDSRSTMIFRDMIGFKNNSSSSLEIVTDPSRRSLNFCDPFNNLSQSTRFFRFGSNSTLLDKLCYTYSYIYKFTTSTATIFYGTIFALLLLLLILMPTTSSSLHRVNFDLRRNSK